VTFVGEHGALLASGSSDRTIRVCRWCSTGSKGFLFLFFQLVHAAVEHGNRAC
jgi:hypothetical protein